MKFSAVLFTYLLVFLQFNYVFLDFVNAPIDPRIKWNDNWAFGCDFKGRDLSNVQIRGEDCGARCSQTSGCTHFTWTTFNGGTCWMKQGKIFKQHADYTGDNSMVCGLMQPNGR